MAKLLIAAGVVLIVIGVLAHFGLLAWFGRLPGDVRIERDGFAFYFPITTMIVLSVALSLLLRVLRELFG